MYLLQVFYAWRSNVSDVAAGALESFGKRGHVPIFRTTTAVSMNGILGKGHNGVTFTRGRSQTKTFKIVVFVISAACL